MLFTKPSYLGIKAVKFAKYYIDLAIFNFHITIKECLLLP